MYILVACWVILKAFNCLNYFFLNVLEKKISQEYHRSVEHYLGPNCLQRSFDNRQEKLSITRRVFSCFFFYFRLYKQWWLPES